MVAHERLAVEADFDFQQEFDDLRRSILPGFVALLLGMAWGAFLYAVIRGKRPGFDDLVLISSFLISYSAYALRERHYTSACWILLLGATFIVMLSPGGRPLSIQAPLAMLLLIAANALLGARHAILVAALMWTCSTLAPAWQGGMMRLSGDHLLALVFYALTIVTTWLAARPLKTAIEWAFTGWRRAREALDEVQQRRGELYRALRALEEATYRIERINNELLIAQREAETAKALKARFAATVSHELRGPLNLILGFSKLMALSPESYAEPLPQGYRGDVDAIYRNAQHVVALVDDILDLSQIEAQRLPLVKDRIDLGSDVIERVIRIVQPLAERKGLYLRRQVAEGLPWILADPVRLRQALLNLLTNAVRFTERGGITVRATLEDDHLLVSVADTGSGIAAEELPKLFQEFQGHQAAQEGDKSTGLGLAISKHLIELHGGRIGVQSTQGKGTTFYFTIPLWQEGPSPSVIVTEDARPHSTLSRDSCLVVHDDPMIVRLLGRYLEDYWVVGLPHDAELVHLLRSLHPRAILTTPEWCDRIRARLGQTPYDVPIISCAMPRMQEEIQLDGVLGYLVKPIMPEALMAIMRQVERDGDTNILVVDDDPDAVRLLERMLLAMPRPYHILKAYDGSQALEYMEKVVPDVVLIDLVMAGLGGRETIQHMRASPSLAQVPIIIVSARDWIEEGTSFRPPLVIYSKEGLDISRGTRCLQALLSVLSPHYPSEQEPVAPLREGLFGRSASGERPLPPTPMPGEAG